MSDFSFNEDFSSTLKDRNAFNLNPTRKLKQLSTGSDVKEFIRSSPASNTGIGEPDFLKSLLEQPKTENKVVQLPTEGVYVSTGFKRISKKIAKILEIQEDVIILEFIVDKNKGKYQTRSFSPKVFDDINLELNNYLIFNTFKRGSTFKTEISDNQSLISKDELPEYNFDNFSNLFN